MTLEQQSPAPTEDAPKDRHILTGTLFRRRSSRVTLSETPPPPKPEPVRRPAKVARMLALAHHLQGAIDRGLVADRAAVARKLGLTRARVTQLLDLLLLAPELQQAVLGLEAVDGAEPMSERALRAVAHAGSWVEQRGGFHVPMSWKSLDNSSSGSVYPDGPPRPPETDPMEKIEPGSPEEARAAFVAVAAEIAQLRKLSLVNLEQKHLELLGVASAVRSRDALIKRISLALQRRATAR